MYPSPIIIKKANERGLRQTFAIRASMLAKAGRMAEATQAYESWKNTTGGNDSDNKEIYDYLRLSNKDEEALDIVTRYRDFLYRRGDTLSVRMLSVLNREALLRVEMGDYEHVPNLGSLIGTIADSLNLRRSSEQMQTTYHLLKEKNESQQRAQWITILTIVLAAVLIISLVILYYVRYIRHRNVELIKVLNGLDAYRRAVINGDSPTSPEVVAALEEMRKLKLPNDLSSEELGVPDDEDRRLYVEMDKQVTRDRLFLKPGLGREDLMRLIGVDKNRFGKMMSKYSDASNTSVYINMKRVEYGAKLLLEHPEYTIAAIASECGMSNTVTFNRTFKEVYNMTPSEYREKMNALLQQKS
jgi:AraC-like DNA-binding protein